MKATGDEMLKGEPLFKPDAAVVKADLRRCGVLSRDAWLLLREFRVPNNIDYHIQCMQFDALAFPVFGALHCNQEEVRGGRIRGIHGFEVKTARCDFVSDAKLRCYVFFCNYLWVVASTGVVKSIDELPPGAGLVLWRGGKRPFKIIREALHRKIEASAVQEVYYCVLKRLTSRPDSALRVGKWANCPDNSKSFELLRAEYNIADLRFQVKRLKKRVRVLSPVRDT